MPHPPSAETSPSPRSTCSTTSPPYQRNPEARGADTAADFAIQKSKIVAAINGLGADVVALQEIENSVKLGEPADEALADLVAGLNEAAGAGTWDYVRTPAALQDAAITDFITSAIIFKPAGRHPGRRQLRAGRRDGVGQRP